jgi:spermidine synthase
MRRRFWDLFIASFGALFFEMLLVRWLPTTIYYLGYYKNCILFATFLGFGCGLATRRRIDWSLSYFGLLAAAGVFGATMIESYTRIVPPTTGEFLWPQPKDASIAGPMVLLLAVVFIATALLMIPLGRLVGIHLGSFPALTAYSINIGASLFGVGSFVLLSYLSFGPVIWFGIAVLPILYFVRSHRFALMCNIAGLVLAIGVLEFSKKSQEYWSPYSKIVLDEPQPTIGSRLLTANNNGHQMLYDLSAKRLASRGNDTSAAWGLVQAHVDIYESSYQIVPAHSVLIVGGGTGNEAAAALRRGVERIDVVEIDPVIIEIGRAFHPERPYLDSRVRIINDDARHYMATTRERYDLVIFGFLDSTSHLSSMSNIRLDNYVYTLESFKAARSLLNPDGLVQITYYALANFVRLRIFAMLQTAFGHPPLMLQLPTIRANVIFFTGPAVWKTSEFVLSGMKLQDDADLYRSLASSALPITDDWPYLNVFGRGIGSDYLLGLAAMILISFFFVWFFIGPTGISNTSATAMSWCFFLQGAGFMLLETNTITRMALVMGSTWIVTSLAVMLVLMAALFSNVIVQRFVHPSILMVMGLLTLATLLNYAVDIHYYLGLSGPIRTFLAALQVYLPMFASSMLFGRLFQQSNKSSYDFGMNMLGALFGGMLEYVSLIVGIRAIYLIALALFLAIIPLHKASTASTNS